MSKKIFSEKDQVNLSRNKYVIRISDKAITYANEFKQLFIDQYMAGKTPKEIFETNGFEVNVIGIQRVKECAMRWRKAYEKDGIIGLADSRKEASGRLLKRERISLRLLQDMPTIVAEFVKSQLKRSAEMPPNWTKEVLGQYKM